MKIKKQLIFGIIIIVVVLILSLIVLSNEKPKEIYERFQVIYSQKLYRSEAKENFTIRIIEDKKTRSQYLLVETYYYAFRGVPNIAITKLEN